MAEAVSQKASFGTPDSGNPPWRTLLSSPLDDSPTNHIGTIPPSEQLRPMLSRQRHQILPELGPRFSALKHQDDSSTDAEKLPDAIDPAVNSNDHFTLSDGIVKSDDVYSSSDDKIDSDGKWDEFEDSEGESVSDESDERDTDEEVDADVKPSVSSDTETRNLLEAAADDEDPDTDDSATDIVQWNDPLNQRNEGPTRSSVSSISLKTPVQRETPEELTTPADSIFVINKEQRKLYWDCFMDLLQTTTGRRDVNGVLSGENLTLQKFFKESGLGIDELSKIWSLSDVNEDGYLNIWEFSMAMHLIFLRTQKNIVLPDTLPSRVRPPLTPVRKLSDMATVSSAGDTFAPDDHPVRTPKNWRQFDFDDGNVQMKTTDSSQLHSHSDEQLQANISERTSPTERLCDFSAVPPLLVDGRPTPIWPSKPLASHDAADSSSVMNTLRLTLSPQLPKGPPPRPPPRPTCKGHARSASLDLNTFPGSSGSRLTASAFTVASASQRCDTLPLTPRSARLLNSTAAYDSLWSPCSALSSRLPSLVKNVDQKGNLSTPSAPPLPHRPKLIDASTQTDTEDEESSKEESTQTDEPEDTDKSRLIELNLDMEARIEQLLTSEKLTFSDATPSQVNWKERCEQLRLLNFQLEKERTKLAQIQLQLELRLQDNVVSQTSTSIKPTSL